MPLRERAYYGLDEIQARLKLTRRELLYLVENGLLKASVRVWDAVIEEGEYDRDADGQTFRLPTDQRRFSGLLDLRPKDAYRLLRHQTAVINAFDAPEGEYLVVLRPEDGIEVRLDDLVVRRGERDRFERTQRPALARMNGNTFKVVGDYKEVIVAGRLFHLGACQAEVVRLLHEAAKTEEPCAMARRCWPRPDRRARGWPICSSRSGTGAS